jgi:hypothetical protein
VASTHTEGARPSRELCGHRAAPSTGAEVRLRRGPAVDAVLASAALPGIYPPVPRRVVTDGGALLPIWCSSPGRSAGAQRLGPHHPWEAPPARAPWSSANRARNSPTVGAAGCSAPALAARPGRTHGSAADVSDERGPPLPAASPAHRTHRGPVTMISPLAATPARAATVGSRLPVSPGRVNGWAAGGRSGPVM